LVLDRSLELCGYQAFFQDPGQGLVLATHKRPRCGTTLSVRAELIRELHNGEFFSERLTGTEECERLCLEQHLLVPCTAHCDMAWVREAMQWLLRHELPPHLARV